MTPRKYSATAAAAARTAATATATSGIDGAVDGAVATVGTTDTAAAAYRAVQSGLSRREIRRARPDAAQSVLGQDFRDDEHMVGRHRR